MLVVVTHRKLVVLDVHVHLNEVTNNSSGFLARLVPVEDEDYRVDPTEL